MARTALRGRLTWQTAAVTAVTQETSSVCLGAQAFLDLDADDLQHVGEVDVVFDVIGRDILKRSTELVRPGGTLVTIAMATHRAAQ